MRKVRSRTSWVVGALIALLSMLPAAAQPASFVASPYVYRIKIGQCLHEPRTRAQTGFRVQGVEGIYTALHGVVDCNVINAVSDEYRYIFNGLSISAVDINRDVALLSSPAMAAYVTEGLQKAKVSDIDYEQLQLIGYPVELEDQLLTTQVVVDYGTQLAKLIPSAYKPALTKRDSPGLNTNVLRAEAHLAPGHSGAPLLTEKGTLVAMANGGLQRGALEIGWAIPWSDVKVQAATASSIRTRLSKLRTLDPHEALAFSSTYPVDPAAMNAGPRETKIVRYIPPLPKAKRTGACFNPSVTSNRIDAWRCAVDSTIYDPCFEIVSLITPGSSARVVCFDNPDDDTTSFQLQLTEPLPARETAPAAELQPWRFQLEDGDFCRFEAGAMMVLDGRRIDYICDSATDNFKVVRDIARGAIYEAEVIYLDREGFMTDYAYVPIQIVWY